MWHNGSLLLSETEVATFHLKHTVKRGRPRNTAVRDRVLSLLNQGQTARDIVTSTGYPWSTVYRIAQERRLTNGEQYGPRERNKVANAIADVASAAQE